MMESSKAKDVAKKKVTRNANPEESLAHGPESGVESDTSLSAKSGSSGPQALVSGYSIVDAELDPFDNERNVDRMKGDHGPMKKSEASEAE